MIASASLRSFEQPGAEAETAVRRLNRETIDVTPPAVPREDDRADDPALVGGDDKRSGIAVDQDEDCFRCIDRTIDLVAGVLPQIENALDVIGSRAAH
jgi:hypothetical protein